ncbi:MAG: RluA family pseudouridine synthase [Gemmatimonadaceae bacterium]|nr:RluA family pseudouridine synthase [Chitinophagaceae bacterium]
MSREQEQEDLLEQDGPEELFERFNIIVDKGQEPMRIDKFLVARIEHATRNKVQKSIEAGRVIVNNKQVQPNYKIRPLDEIIVYTDKEIRTDEIIPEDMDLNIVFEDNDIIIINKPAGMVVHPGSGNPTGTLINGIAGYLTKANKDLSEEMLPRFGMVHRIDKNTTGLLVLAKTDKAVSSLAKQFFDHTVHRQYIALVWGDVKEDQGTVRAHVGRNIKHRKQFAAYPDGDHGKEAVTHYEVIERFGYVTLISCKLETGRTHQIRVHMQHLGHPLFNDDMYGGDRIVKGTVFNKYKQFVDNCFEICNRHALHAKTIGFTHPTTRKEVMFESELASDMTAVIQKWRGYVNSIQMRVNNNG